MTAFLLVLLITLVPLAYALGCWMTAGDWIAYIKRNYP